MWPWRVAPLQRIFRPSVQNLRTYVDGGLWANNPSLVAVIEAHSNLDARFEDIRLVSLGNGNFPDGIQSDKYNSTRPIGMIGNIFELMFASQNAAADDCAEQLIGLGNLLRLNVDLAEPIHLDDVKTAVSVLPPRAE